VVFVCVYECVCVCVLLWFGEKQADGLVFIGM
jgi:hypothetical protein